MGHISRSIDEITDYTVLQLQKDKEKRGAFFYAVFDNTGDFVHIKLPHNRTISPAKSFYDYEIKSLGLHNIISREEEEKREYLASKGLKVYDKCHCIVSKKIIENVDNCHIKDCISPKHVIKLEINGK